MNWYVRVMMHYSDFKGRARRKEYWMYTLFNFLFSIAALAIDFVISAGSDMPFFGFVILVFTLGHIIPGLAVTIRRLHDVNQSGWMLLIGLIPLIGGIWLLILLLSDSKAEENQWGASPKALA